jgi:SAM-dependent methyltransferase
VANETETRRWNDERWTAAWPKREALTSAVSPALLRAINAQPGQRVLDVGCGGGGLSLALARAVGPDGDVVGVDISAALVELARQRARDAVLFNVMFLRADMQVDPMEVAPFDVVVSQFGVMFFDEPDRAFSALRRQLRPGARLVFATWQSVELNPWHTASALRSLVPPVAPPTPGKSLTGPFTLGDPAHTIGILERAGFTRMVRTTFDLTVEAPGSAVAEPSLLPVMGVAPEDLGEATAILARHLDQFHLHDDVYAFPLAFQVFEATNPG